MRRLDLNTKTGFGFFAMLIIAVICLINYELWLQLEDLVRFSYVYLVLGLSLVVVAFAKNKNSYNITRVGVGEDDRLKQSQFIHIKKRKQFNSILVMMGRFLILWIAVLHIIWYFVFYLEGEVGFFVNWSGATLLVPVVFWFLGELIGYGYPITWDNKASKIFIACTVVICVLIAINGLMESFRYGRGVGMMVWNPISRTLYDYQFVADMLAIVGLLWVGIIYRTNKTRAVIAYILIMIPLFFLNSRSAFYIYTIIGVIYLSSSGFLVGTKGMSAASNVRLLKMLSIAFVIVVTFVAINKLIFDNTDVYIDRALYERMITFSHEASSIVGRVYLLNAGLMDLKSHWILGKYAAEWWRDGIKGGYIHNYLSFLLSYGVGPFILLLAMMFSALKKSVLYARVNRDLLPLAVLLYCMISIAISRSYIWPFIWLALGYVSSLEVVVKRR